MRVQKIIFLIQIDGNWTNYYDLYDDCYYNSTKNYDNNYRLGDLKTFFSNLSFAFDTIVASQKNVLQTSLTQ